MNIDVHKWLGIAFILSMGVAPMQALASGAHGHNHNHNTTEQTTHHTEVNSQYSVTADFDNSGCGDDFVAENDLAHQTGNNASDSSDSHHCKSGTCECDHCDHGPLLHLNLALTSLLFEQYKPQLAGAQSKIKTLNQDNLPPIEIRPPISFFL